MLTGKAKAAQFGITRPGEVFQALSEIFDCARWGVRAEPGGFPAEAKGRKLCAIARRMGAPGPCYIYCLDPMEGMIIGPAPDMEFAFTETLWSGSRCRVEVSR